MTILLLMMTISTSSEQVDDSCSSTSDPPQGVDSAPWGNNYLINKLIAIGDDLFRRIDDHNEGMIGFPGAVLDRSRH